MTDRRQQTELLVPGPAEAFAGLLDVPCPDLDDGEPLPVGWHWFYLLERPAQRDLGPDGHPVRGVLPSPPGPGLRRMWAGGAVQTLHGLRTGSCATRTSRVADTVTKQGRSGTLVFVTVEHEVAQGGRTCVHERQDIVYREQRPDRPSRERASTAARDDSVIQTKPAPDALHDGDWSIHVDATLLFRFSALTYNAHRIHYDRSYAGDVEGYPGLLTHGPLQALAMMESARAAGALRAGVPSTFEYRLQAPLLDHEGMVVRTEFDPSSARESGVSTVSDRSGRVAARAAITIR
jgi:3-methylfumaryl-CoA hydratase